MIRNPWSRSKAHSQATAALRARQTRNRTCRRAQADAEYHPRRARRPSTSREHTTRVYGDAVLARCTRTTTIGHSAVQKYRYEPGCPA